MENPGRLSIQTLLISGLIAVPVWVTPLYAGALLWDTSTSAPSPLALGYASAINNSGIVVGSVGSFLTQQAAEVSISAPNLLIPLSGVPLESSASDINSLGQISGSYEDLGGYEHAFVWSSTTGMQLLGNLGGNLSTAWAINDAGQIVGQTATAAGPQAFLWSSRSLSA